MWLSLSLFWRRYAFYLMFQKSTNPTRSFLLMKKYPQPHTAQRALWPDRTLSTGAWKLLDTTFSDLEFGFCNEHPLVRTAQAFLSWLHFFHIAQMCLLIYLFLIRNNLNASSAICNSSQVACSALLKEEMCVQKHVASVFNQRDVGRLLWFTVLWKTFSPCTIFGDKQLFILSVEHVYKPMPHLWSLYICVTTPEEVKRLHMIISLAALASRLTRVILQRSGAAPWIHFLDDCASFKQLVLKTFINQTLSLRRLQKKRTREAFNVVILSLVINRWWLKACEMATINLPLSTLATAAIDMLSAEPQESDSGWVEFSPVLMLAPLPQSATSLASNLIVPPLPTSPGHGLL